MAEQLTTEGKPKMKKKKTRAVLMILISLMLVIAAGMLGFMIGSSMIKPPSVHVPALGHSDKTDKDAKEDEFERVDGVYNVLIVGVDKVALNTDTILVASLDSKNDKINILSIPRDTMSNVNRNVKKINAAFGSGAKEGKGNIENLKKEVGYLVGFDVDHYVVVNLAAFEELVDAIGGVKIDVPRNMNYDDPYQNLHIHIKAGEQVLNGEQAVGFCRYRSGYAEGDLGRVKAQQLFMKALIHQVATPAILPKLPQLAQIIEDNMETDLSTGEIIWFAKEALGVNLEEDLQTFILPGEARYVKGLSYFIPNETGILEMVNESFNPYETEITRKDLNLVDVASLPKETKPEKQEEEKSESDETDSSDNPLAQEELKPTENEDSSQNQNDKHPATQKNDNTDGTDNGERDEMKQEASGDVSASGTDAMPGEVLKQEPTVSDSDSQEKENDSSSLESETQDTSDNTPSGGGNVPGEVLKSDVETD